MPLLGREKGRSPRSRRSDDEFVVFLQGIPAHCRWQELKDLVRQTALHIRQAVVYDDSHGFPTGLGQIIVKNEDEAWRTYHRLSTNGWEGQSLVVTLARTSAPTKPIAGPTRSPPAMIQGYMSGHSTPPRSQGNMTMPPSPISPESVHSGSPPYPYPEFAPMGAPMAIPQQPYMPMMPDHPMQCVTPSPMMHCSPYEAPGWNMMPMYPISPVQPLPDHAGDHYPRYHPRKPWASHPTSDSPVPDLTQRAVYIENLSAATTTSDLKSLLQGAGTVEQCNLTVTSEAYDTQAQTHASAIMLSVEEARRAVTALNGMTFMGARIRVKMEQPPNMARSGSWDGTVTQDEPDLMDPAASEKSSECSGCGQDVLFKSHKQVDPHKPLVVDGSGLQKKSLELLSTSAPT
ncbi:Nucleotide-binding alpha-beta plait [Penicillium canariense]|uniref:Nucleotide-binding alpha-beta plait n=1 Tax=Penicillium canariense TaxID=189055 RepID=A0A9W9HVJ8_9EURO|nr:Nucleotide-binding alpha-beta plait [Penicillium canariense]KAJ5156960.1 Nucleotide-binding alpha-beta plait [Penicillium canariense]